MNITFVTEHYAPDPGGVATSSARVAEGLVAQGHRLQVLTFDNSRSLAADDYSIESSVNGVVVSRFGPFFLRHPDLATTPISEKLRAVFRRRACARMVEASRAFAADLVLSFYLLNAGFLSRFIAADLDVPYVAGVRGNDVGLNAFHVERFAAVRWTLEGASRVVCVNEHLRRRTERLVPERRGRIAVIANGVAGVDVSTDRTGARSRLMAATGWCTNDLVIVFIGTLREKKGIVRLVHALQTLAPAGGIRLLVVGPEIGSVERHLCGATWDALRASGRVFCTGQLPRQDVSGWAAGGDVVVMPSIDDGLANGLLEGMALGLCPLVSDIFADVLTPASGCMFDQRDPASLVEALAQLAANRARVSSMGLEAQRLVRSNHRPEREAATYADLFRTVLQEEAALVS